jgi:hypothetical protein
MSGYYNKKEEVIEIQLTQYGKELLAKGKFKPSHYAFFDDDILYDIAYSDGTEEQNDAQDRILENTPRLKAQYVYSSIENSVYKSIERVRSGEESIRSEIHRQVPASDYAFSAPLGNSKFIDEYIPAWKIIPLMGEIDSATIRKSGLYPTQNVPLISMTDVEYKTKVKRNGDGDLDGDIESTEGLDFASFDGVQDLNEKSVETFSAVDSTVELRGEGVLFEIKEENAPFDKDNFEIEFFLIEDVIDPAVGGTVEKLTPLNITPKTKNNIVNGILLDEQNDQAQVVDIDSTYIEYYLDISTDSEIDNAEICELVDKYDNRDEFYSNQELGCSPVSETSPSKKVYGADPTTPEEDC